MSIEKSSTKAIRQLPKANVPQSVRADSAAQVKLPRPNAAQTIRKGL